MSVTAAISAQGGAGGTNLLFASGKCGGPGGGGSGGSLWLQSIATPSFTPATNVDVRGGAGGTDVCVAGVDGGPGSPGIARVDGAASFASAGGINTDGGTHALINSAVFSKPIDLGTSFGSDYIDLDPPIVEQTVGGGCNTGGSDLTDIAVTYQGTNDGGATYTAEVIGADIGQLSEFRAIRFIARFTPDGGSINPCLTRLTFPFRLRTLNNLTLTGGLFFCGTVKRPPGPWTSYAGNLALLLIAFSSPLWMRHLQRSYRPAVPSDS
jgi:hypothetical protein